MELGQTEPFRTLYGHDEGAGDMDAGPAVGMGGVAPHHGVGAVIQVNARMVVAEATQKKRDRFGEGDFYRGRIRGLNAHHFRELAREGRCLGVHGPLDGKNHILSRQLSVIPVKHHAFTDLKSPDFSIRRGSPLLGQRWNDISRVLVEFDQPFKNLIGHASGNAIGDDGGIEVLLRKARDGERRDGAAAHGIDVAEGVGGGDLAIRIRVVDDGREEVDRLDKRRPSRPCVYARIVGRAEIKQDPRILLRRNAAQDLGELARGEFARSTRTADHFGQTLRHSGSSSVDSSQ